MRATGMPSWGDSKSLGCPGWKGSGPLGHPDWGAQNPLSDHTGDAHAGGFQNPPGWPGWRRSGCPGGPGWGAQDPQEEQSRCSCCPMDGDSWHRGTPGLLQSEGRLRMWLWCRDGEVAQRKEGVASTVGSHGAGPQPCPVALGTRWGAGCPNPCQHWQPGTPSCTHTPLPAPCTSHLPSQPYKKSSPWGRGATSQLSQLHLPLTPHTGAQGAPHALPGCCALCTDINGSGEKKNPLNCVSGLEGSWKQHFRGCVPSRCS